MINVNLYDNSFQHDPTGYSVAGQRSKHIKWLREDHDPSLPTFYCNGDHFNVCDTPKEKSYAWIFESQSIFSYPYNIIESYTDKYDLIFTHSSTLLKKYKNTRWIPGGGVWIGGLFSGGEIGIKEKKKICSMVSSSKSMCDLHRFRGDIILKIADNMKVDAYGTYEGGTGWCSPQTALDDYCFSIIIENYIDDLYITEKILNCFATGTVPIYYGARDVNTKFNGEGILTFTTEADIQDIIKNISIEMYKDMLPHVEDNYNRVLDYISIEDYIFDNYHDIIFKDS